MSRVVLAGADEDLILRVKQAADGDVAVRGLLDPQGQVLVGSGQYDAAHEKSFS